MKLQSKRKPYDDINITPMVDLTFVLLVIFILMTTAAIQGVKVNLPKASSSVSLAQPTTKAITVDSAGQIYLDTFPVTLDELESELRTLKSATPEFPVVIKGDRVSQYGRIMEVLDVCGRVGITQIGLVSERVRSS
ncbi:biopolymer transporter ExbD [Asticcacaulis sp. ZE23SCel15]|jgi:biopolymer transport protein ExbD|uniref:ExbD/TolR family protein n=1 Tax=Asticcacaulis sp. ZE23SCel15 TaxID=3059027 RepID=UPI00265F9D91|nr:biopolymer transporter ExbD [Asticcacaulis sp. ZE23SCel15]WKL58952.1 biopolymer transporter ExbD [Asticcacaulis sp. ZE23SCel15]